jgi:arylformamidase
MKASMFQPRLFAASLLALCASLHAAPGRIEADIAYGPAVDQRYDVYLPPPAAQPAPAIVMAHGGAWRLGDKENRRVVEHKAARWQPRGIAFISVNYRMLPDNAPLDQARDVARALAHVQQNAARWGVDRERIVLIGHSAGAHLIALLAARPDLAADAGARPWLGTVLLDSGALDVPAIMNARHPRLYDRAFGENPAYWRAVSPYHQLAQPGSPILAVCSTQRSDACPQADAFAAKARLLGGAVDVLALDKSHGEINADLGRDPDYTTAVEAFLGRLSPAFAVRLSR